MDNAIAERIADMYTPVVWTREEMLSRVSERGLRSRLRDGRLHRIRRDRYTLPGANPGVQEAVRIGGRFSCLSLLSAIGVFVHRCSELHVHLAPGSSRIRPPHASSTVLHWVETSDVAAPLHVASVADAVRQSLRCQQPRAALATLDSVINLGVMTHAQVIELLCAQPARFHALIPLVDGSAGSGPETFTRLILRSLGVKFRTQVAIQDAGIVDFLVEGWLVIECDSKAHHGGWDQQRKDRYRDLAAARQGFVTIRLLATDAMERPDWVRATIEAVLAAFGPQRAGR